MWKRRGAAESGLTAPTADRPEVGAVEQAVVDLAGRQQRLARTDQLRALGSPVIS